MNRPSHTAPVVISLGFVDGLCVVAAAAIAAAVVAPAPWTENFGQIFSDRIIYITAFMIAWPFTGTMNRLFISRRRDFLLQVIFDICKSVFLSLIFTGFIVAFYTRLGTEFRFFSYFGLSTLFLIALFRSVLQLVLYVLRKRGVNEREILVVGVNERTRDLVKAIHEHPHYGYRIAGVLEDEPDRCRMVEEYSLPYLGNFEALEHVLDRHVIDEVYICLPVRSRYETIQHMAQLCEAMGVSVRMIADLFPLRLATSRFHKLEHIPILALSTVPENQPQLILQRLTDVTIASLALLILSPVFIATAIAIKLNSPGPVFFTQERVGLNRRRFHMIKFRSMVTDAEALRREVEQLNEVEGPMFKAARDPRITPVGRFIRKYSIDELPQLFNVLMGHMSLVGPRPPLPSEVDQYARTHLRRLSVKPGMTGLSQISGRSELSFRDTVDLDLYYIDQWSLAMVFRILLLTVPAVLKGRGAM